MRPDTKTPWQQIHVWAYETAALFGLDEPERLAALHRWRLGARPSHVWFYGHAAEIRALEDVDWSDFPDQAAQQAVRLEP